MYTKDHYDLLLPAAGDTYPGVLLDLAKEQPIEQKDNSKPGTLFKSLETLQPRSAGWPCKIGPVRPQTLNPIPATLKRPKPPGTNLHRSTETESPSRLFVRV